jgi:hypothetical protein
MSGKTTFATKVSDTIKKENPNKRQVSFVTKYSAGLCNTGYHIITSIREINVDDIIIIDESLIGHPPKNELPKIAAFSRQKRLILILTAQQYYESISHISSIIAIKRMSMVQIDDLWLRQQRSPISDCTTEFIIDPVVEFIHAHRKLISELTLNECVLFSNISQFPFTGILRDLTRTKTHFSRIIHNIVAFLFTDKEVIVKVNRYNFTRKELKKEYESSPLLEGKFKGFKDQGNGLVKIFYED